MFGAIRKFLLGVGVAILLVMPVGRTALALPIVPLQVSTNPGSTGDASILDALGGDAQERPLLSIGLAASRCPAPIIIDHSLRGAGSGPMPQLSRNS
jgi:hypothetical protein